jgi:hypothetical protein
LISSANKIKIPPNLVNVPSIFQENILAVALIIICRIPEVLAAGEEWKYRSAEGKTTGSNFSRFFIKNFRYRNDTEKLSSSSSSANATVAADSANTTANSYGYKGRAWTGPQLRTVCNTGTILYSHRRG